jgi:hypothetical protein
MFLYLFVNLKVVYYWEGSDAKAKHYILFKSDLSVKLYQKLMNDGVTPPSKDLKILESQESEDFLTIVNDRSLFTVLRVTIFIVQLTNNNF